MPKFGTSLAALGPSDPQYWHLHGRGEEDRPYSRSASRRTADPKFAPGAGRRSCSSKSHAAYARATRIDPNVAAEAGRHRPRPRRHDLHDGRRRQGQHGVADPVAVLRLRHPRIVAGDTGIVLHNRGSAFNARPGHPEHRSRRTSGRSTRSSPAFVMKDGTAVGVVRRDGRRSPGPGARAGGGEPDRLRDEHAGSRRSRACPCTATTALLVESAVPEAARARPHAARSQGDREHRRLRRVTRASCSTRAPAC